MLIISKVNHERNQEIRDPKVRLIGPDGAQLGIMSAKEANAIADKANLDLVKISPTANPPVCKIMDYSKFCFDQKKKEKDAKKKQKALEEKEIRMSPGIDTNDLNTKIRAAQKFLADGHRVRISIRFRGREITHANLSTQLLQDFAAQCSEVSALDKAPNMDGRNMVMVLSPKNK